MNECEFYLEDLKIKFSKIDPTKYYLAYSGGRDSHFLLWFIREYLHETRIPFVFSNTGMELPEIRERGLSYSDIVLKPAMKHTELKEKHGIPLNTKSSDQWVWEYQRRREQGISDEDMPDWVKYYAMRQVDAIERGRETGKFSITVVGKKTCTAMLNGTLHKVSHHCCTYLKKMPGKLYEKETGKKKIVGVMQGESWRRDKKITSCFNKKGQFSPLHDLTEELRNKIEIEYQIPVPKVYKFVNQTGCAGCPYSQHGKDKFYTTNLTLSLCHEGQRKFILDYFKESYEFKGYEFRQMLFSSADQL